MPIMSKPSGSIWSEHPVLAALRAAGSKIGLDDPSAVMGVGGAMPLPGATSVVPEATGAALRGLKAASPWDQVATYLKGGGAVPGASNVSPMGQIESYLANRAAPVAETIGEIDPEFTPVGGEAMYNAGKTAMKPLVDPIEAVYKRILEKGGR